MTSMLRLPSEAPAVLQAEWCAPALGLGSPQRVGVNSSPGGRYSRPRGFSTLELLVVVSILVIIVAVGLPGLTGTIQRYKARAAADQVLTDLRRTQGYAMSSGKKHRLYFQDCASGPTPCKRYRIDKIKDDGTWPGSSDTASTSANVLTEWIDLQNVYGSVRIKSLKDNGSTDRDDVIFDSRGASTNTGSGAYPLTVTVTHTSGEQRTVEVRSAGTARMQ